MEKVCSVVTEYVKVDQESLYNFCRRVFVAAGLTAEDAHISADVLVAADVRGIPSHGVGRLWRYANGIESGLMQPQAKDEVLMESPSSLVIDAHGGMGAPVSVRTMRRVIDKAHEHGVALGCVRESNHFGIAAYYAMLAMDKDMLGVAMTNSAVLGVPTFGRLPMYGTNPIAFAAPAAAERSFVLDMSTTVVTRGKIEVYDRLEKEMPEGWAVDAAGREGRDPAGILRDLSAMTGGILPLGGAGEMFGGHKGYGLAVMVDILCAVLCGAPSGAGVMDTATSSARVSHFFGAIRIDRFRDPAEFRRDMDRMLADLRACPPAEGAERVYFAGEKEFEHEQRCRQEGVPVLVRTLEQIVETGARYGVDRSELILKG